MPGSAEPVRSQLIGILHLDGNLEGAVLGGSSPVQYQYYLHRVILLSIRQGIVVIVH